MQTDRITHIKESFARERVEMPLARHIDDMPISYEAITPEWMTAVLCKDHPGAAVTMVRLGPVDSGSSERRRIFLDYNAEGRAAGLPPTVFCKATHDLVTRILGSNASTHSEVTFYTKVRPTLDIEAPEALFARYDPESYLSIIILKDIADHATFCSPQTVINRGKIESQLELLATLHGPYYDNPRLKGDLSTVVTFAGRFDGLVASHDIERVCDNGFVAAEEVIPAALFRRRAEIWPATLASLKTHLELPMTLNHGDDHLKNWYQLGGDKMGLGDWQVFCRGHWSRDLAYTISTALSTEDRRVWEKDLIAFYLDRLQAHGGPKVSIDEAWRHYRQQMMTTLAWWTLTLTPSAQMPDMQPRETTLIFLQRIAAAMDDLATLDSFG